MSSPKKDETVPLSTTEPTTHHQRPNEEVLVGGLPVPRRHVLIPVDGTPQSEYMVDWALANFCREGDQVNLIHVIPNRYPSNYYSAFEEYVPDLPDPEQEAAWRSDAEKYMAKKIYPMLKASGVQFTAEVVAYETDNSSIGEIICERATDTDAAAVIMASHGKGRVREFFIGSVTNYCLHRCKKPVVIFRSPPTIDAEEKTDQPASTEEKKAELEAELIKHHAHLGESWAQEAAEKNGGAAPAAKAAAAAAQHVHAE